LKLRTLATTALIGSTIGLLAASPASAALSGSVTLGATTVAPGGSTSVTVSVTETIPVLGGTQVITTITAGAGATGTVQFSTLSGASNLNCVPPDPTESDCLWTVGSTSGGATLTASASASAAGSFQITTVVIGDDPSTPAPDIVTRTVGTATLTVQAPPPSTTTAPSTTAAPTTGAPTTAAPATTTATASGGRTLPTVGTSGLSWAIVVVAMMVLMGGGVAVRLARRSET
jgi:hypothetical protein